MNTANLSVIFDESSGSGGHDPDVYPIATDAQEVGPLDIFPEEVWLEIFKRLDNNPRDLLHAGESCKYFQELLERGSAGVPGAGKNVCELVEILPLALKWLGKKDILNLHGVCRRVCQTVDQVLEKTPRINMYENFNLFPWLTSPLPLESPRRLSFEGRCIKLPKEVCPYVILNSEERITSLTNELEANKRKKGGQRRIKIVGKCIRILWKLPLDDRPRKIFVNVGENENVEDGDLAGMEVDEDEENENDEDNSSDGMSEEDEEESDDDNPEPSPEEIAKINKDIAQQRDFLEKCIQFFKQFPEQIRFLRVSLSSSADFFEMYIFLDRVIRSLFYLYRFELDLPDSTFFLCIVDQNQLDRLIKFIHGHSLTFSPILEAISIKNYYWPVPFLQEISETYGDQLKELTLAVGNRFDTVDHFEVRHHPQRQMFHFPVLQKLKLISYDELLSVVFAVEAPLLKSLKLSYSPQEVITSFGRLIAIIMKYPLLVDLKMDLVNIVCMSRDAVVAMHHLDYDQLVQKNLRKLRIVRAEDSNIPLRFFTRLCPNLESITVVKDNLWEEYSMITPDFKMMRARCMKKSGIWEEAVNIQNIKHVRRVDLNTWNVYECNRP